MKKIVEETLKERGEVYGYFRYNAATAQMLKTASGAYDNRKQLSYEQAEAVDMILTKISRIVCGSSNQPDSWLDIAGYAHLAYEATCERHGNE